MSNNMQSLSLLRLQESLVPIIKDKAGYVRPYSFSEAVSKNRQTILTIQKKGGLKNLVGWVKGRLIELFTYLGAFETVTEFQVQMLATRICAKYFWITPGELDYFFLCFQNGEYGKLYNGKTINPQDIMQGLILYEKDLLEARGRAEEQRMAAEEARRKAEEAKKPHGLAGWKKYCEDKGLDPNTHQPASFNLIKDMNEVLHPKRNEDGIIKNK